MRKSLKLIPALCMLLISAMLVGTSTYAWFSMNRTVSATNMSVKAKAGPSLIITDDFVSGGTTTLQFTAGKVEESKSAENPVVYPATKYVDTMLDNTNSHDALAEPATKLAYVANGGDVDPNTGLAKSTKTLYYAAATTASSADGTTTGYYYDFDFYLSAEGEAAITEGTLKVNIPAVSTPAENALKATTVLVLVNGTVYGDPVVLTTGTATAISTIDCSATNIPAVNMANYQLATSSAVKVTLRVYVDGALLESSGTETFVRNSAIVDLTRSVTFGATFTVE